MKFNYTWLLPLFLCCTVISACAEQSTEKKPNILLILLDDLGVNDLGKNNGGATSTPNIDQLAQQGLYFSRHYTDSTCAPSRAALLTGKRPSKLGYTPVGLGLSPELITLPEFLQSQNYATNHIGKWHLGHRKKSAWPDQQGFDFWFGFLHQFELSGPRDADEQGFKQPTYFNPWLQGSEQDYKQFNGHLNDILTNSAIKRIEQLEHAGAPWFLNLWFFAPHTPVQASPEYISENTAQGRYAALVSQADNNIGLIIQKLKELEAFENTIIILTSDNGGTNRQFANNAPFEGKKAEYLEGGLRTPLIMLVPKEADTSKVVSLIDIYPTLAELLNAETVELDGRSIFQKEVSKQHWVLELPLGTSFSSLAKDGASRLTMHGMFNYQGNNKAPDFQALKPSEIAISPEYLQFKKDIIQDRTLQLHSSKSTTHPYIEISGDKFRRISGYDGLSVSIAITPEVNEKTKVLMEQSSHWQLTQKQQTLALTAYGEVLETELTFGECDLITMSFYLGRSDLRPDLEKGWIALYKNRKLQQLVHLKSPDIEQLDFSANTLLLDNTHYAGTISKPFFYKKALKESGWPDNLEVVPDLCN